MTHRNHQLITKHDWIEIKSDLKLAGEPKVKILNRFKLSAGDSFVTTKVDGDLSGQYDGHDEGDSVGKFKSDNGGTLDLFVTYQGGDGNDIELYTKSFFGVLPDSLSEPRIIGSDDDVSFTRTSADEVIFGAVVMMFFLALKEMIKSQEAMAMIGYMGVSVMTFSKEI